MTRSKNDSNFLNEINDIDHQIYDLILKRVQLFSAIEEKLTNNFSAVLSKVDTEMFRIVEKHESNAISSDDLSAIFHEISIACRTAEQAGRVAVLGPSGTYSETAAYKFYGHKAKLHITTTIEEVFTSVSTGVTGYGVVPVENSTEGTVNNTLDSFQNHRVKICGEIELPIQHSFMTLASNKNNVKTIYAHSQSLAQCRQWLNQNAPLLNLVAVSSNAEGARLAAEDNTAAAIASESTALLYGLNRLERNIQDLKNNTTRFLILSLKDTEPTGSDKTSLMLSVPNRPGALYELLRPLSDFNVSMTKIESRPARAGLWEYMFFVDVEGHHLDSNVSNALEELRRNSSVFELLGSYVSSRNS
jgi:chorismate mutase / prephenate dehydratase